MTAPAKMLGRSRWKRPSGETKAPPRQKPAASEPAQSPDLAKFMSAFGSLKDKDVFGGDAVEFQREMREEWR